MIGIIIVVFFYGKVLVDPNGYMFSDSGDGIKNYYTYAYHIEHDSSYTNFEGMNYPYGENYLYTDCHPIVANTAKFLADTVPWLETHAVGLLNFILILSIFFTFIVVYLLLVELKSNKWLSILFSIGITLLAPQIFRLEGHLALSYSVAIPLSWLILLKIIRKPSKLKLMVFFLNNLFWMFIHAYLGVIIISFLASVLLLQVLLDKERKNALYNYIGLAIAILSPVILFYIYVGLTDIHEGRTDNPAGFFLYNAELDDILLPHDEPFRPILDKLSGGIIKLKWEARGYLGLVNALLFISLIVTAILSFFNAKAKAILRTVFSNKLLNISLVAASIVLLFAMGLPFKQFPDLLEALPIFKQFRATGRFVWPFYFAFTVFAAIVFQSKLGVFSTDKRRRGIGIVLLALLIGTSYAEGFQYHKTVSQGISKSANLFKKDLLSAEFAESIESIKPDDYQAIIAFPFYYQGSDSYARPRNDEAVRNSLVLSYHTGIPVVCANLTRTSIEESKRIVQIVSPNYYSKKITEDLNSDKPFLILKSGGSFTQYEQIIINKGRSIHATNEFELLQITKDDLFSDDSKKVIDDFQERLPELGAQDSFLVSSLSSVLYYNGFENTKSDISFRGEGSFESIKKGKNTFVEFPANTFQKDQEYDLSMWMYNGEADALNLWFRLEVEEFDEVNDTWHSTTFFPEYAEVINGDWSLVEGVFTVNDSRNKVYIVSMGKENSKAMLHADDLLIKDRGIDIYRSDSLDHSLFYNNHRIPLPL